MYGIEVRVTGSEDRRFQARELSLRKGEPLPPTRPLVGQFQHDDSVHSFRTVVNLEGIVERNRTISGAGDLAIAADAALMTVSVSHSESAPEGCLVEWLVNFATDPERLPGATFRNFGDFFERIRSTSKVILQFKSDRRAMSSANDHFVLTVRVGDNEWILTVGHPESGHCNPDLKPGFVEYRSADGRLPDNETRRNVITALSFALGCHLIAVGWTAFDCQGRPTRAACHRALGLDRNHLISNPSKPPCSLAMGTMPTVDSEVVRELTQAVLDLFQRGLDIDFPLWLTWLASASPLDACAAHYGAAIEALRSRFYATTVSGSTTLLPSADWRIVREGLEHALDEKLATLCPAPKADDLKMLRNNLGGINNKSSGAKYPEFFRLLDLAVDQVEMAALRERNRPAHGTEYDPSQYVALKANVDALHTLFNRIVLKLAGCGRSYFDYSTYGHPVRNLADPLGGPQGDRKAATV